MSYLSYHPQTQFFDFSYRHLLKPILFQFDAEAVHNSFTTIGSLLARSSTTRDLTRATFAYHHPALTQKIHDIKFTNPVGLSAGFDYNGDLTGILGDVGFGFESMGTVTYLPYQGNPPPRLGRLPISKSLLVNKGFKSHGIHPVLDHVVFNNSNYNIGISIGATNSPDTSTPKAQMADIINSFEFLLSHPTAKKFAYYELNISCPNVAGSGSMANPKDLKTILGQINKLKLKKPLFVKFQLEIDWPDAKKLIKIMVDQGVAGIIESNLLKHRDSQYLNQQEVKTIKHLKGNFSGKPTWKLSNDLISHTYQEFGSDIIIVGVGGIFSAEDAYEKIKRGASLVELITGMIYQGPQLIGAINQGLVQLLHQDGYSNISEAVGAYYR